MARMSASLTTSPVGYRRLSSWALTRRPVAVRVCPINSTTVSQVRSGLPRQFCVMWQKRRWSILFHLLVPGGELVALMRQFVLFAIGWYSNFLLPYRFTLIPPAAYGKLMSLSLLTDRDILIVYAC